MTFGSDGLFCNSRGLPEGSTRYRWAAGQRKWRRLGTPARPFFCFCFTGPFTPAFAQCPFLLVFPTKNGHFEEAPSCLLSLHQYSLLCSSLPHGGCGHPRSGQNHLPGQDVGKVWVYVCTLTLQPDRCLSELGIRVTATGRAVCWTHLVRQGKSDKIHLLVQSLARWAVPGMPVLYPTLLCALKIIPSGASVLQWWVPGSRRIIVRRVVWRDRLSPCPLGTSSLELVAAVMSNAGLMHTELTHSYLELIGIK